MRAGGRADQDLLYVEISRASEGFELVVDDRELLAERLAERPGIDEGALEVIGADLTAPVVDPDLFAGLQADWRQWPELCWKASSLDVAPEALDEHRQWRGEGDRLMTQARNLLMDRGEDGRHLSAMEGVRSGLESSLARIETVQTADDLAREIEDRGSHIEALRVNHDALRRPSGEVAPTVRWHRYEPLVPGDRLRWTDTSGAGPQDSEAIVLSISAGNRPSEVRSIKVERLGDSTRASYGPGRTETLRSWNLNNLTENCGCRRVL